MKDKDANKNKSIKIKDVAKLVGVSPSTVSYVLTGKRPVSEEMKKKVLEKIELLGYKPNAVARNLASRKTNTIGLYCSKYSKDNDLFFLRMLNGIMDSLSHTGYKILLVNDIESDENFSLPIDWSFPIDGAIITHTRNSQIYLEELQKENIPFLLIGKPPKNVDVNYIDNDNVKAFYNSVEYLFKQKIKRIGIVINQSQSATLNLDAVAGYVIAHSDYQVPYDDRLIFRIDEGSEGSVEKAFELFEAYEIEGLIVAGLFMPIINRLFKSEDLSRKIRPVIFAYDILSKYNFCLDGEIAYIESNAYKLGFDAAASVVKCIEDKRAGVEQKLLEATLKIWRPD